MDWDGDGEFGMVDGLATGALGFLWGKTLADQRAEEMRDYYEAELARERALRDAPRTDTTEADLDAYYSEEDDLCDYSWMDDNDEGELSGEPNEEDEIPDDMDDDDPFAWIRSDGPYYDDDDEC